MPPRQPQPNGRPSAARSRRRPPRGPTRRLLKRQHDMDRGPARSPASNARARLSAAENGASAFRRRPRRASPGSRGLVAAVNGGHHRLNLERPSSAPGALISGVAFCFHIIFPRGESAMDWSATMTVTILYSRRRLPRSIFAGGWLVGRWASVRSSIPRRQRRRAAVRRAHARRQDGRVFHGAGREIAIPGPIATGSTASRRSANESGGSTSKMKGGVDERSRSWSRSDGWATRR